MTTSPDSPKISVIVPVYNAEKYLRECLDSVVNQTLREIEIICVDDGSTDGSTKILAEYAARDPRVRVITQKNAGVGNARNAGILAAGGEFVFFADSDDLLPDADVLKTLFACAKRENVKACGGSMRNLNPRGKTHGFSAKSGALIDCAFGKDELKRYADYQFDYAFYRFIYSRQMLVENKIFFPDYIRYQDPPFMARALDAAGTFYAIRKETYRYRHGQQNIDWTNPRRICDQLRGLRDLLKFSRERGYAKLHWLQIHRLFGEFKDRIVAAVKRERETAAADRTDAGTPDSAAALLQEIDAIVCFPLIWRYKEDEPFRCVREEFNIGDCCPHGEDAPFPRDTVDCVFITDDAYVTTTAVAINSIRRSRAAETKVRVHIVAAALSEYSCSVFQLLEEENFSVEIIKIDAEKLAELSKMHQYVRGGYCMASPAALLKFSLPDLLPNLNRVLYLDGDTLIRKDLKQLFQTPLGRDYVAAVTDPWVVTDVAPAITRLGKYYFNSGMMLLNLEILRQNKISEILFDEKRRSTDFRLMDQPIFNAVFAGHVRYLPMRYNCCPFWWLSRLWALTKREILEKCRKVYNENFGTHFDLVSDDCVLLHFAGKEKPWNNKSIPFAAEWQIAADDFASMRDAATEQGKLKIPTPTISVVVPVYNVEKYLKECLDSLLKQTFKGIEIICVNDGSRDGSRKILERIAFFHAEKIRILDTKNCGLSAARNHGLAAAKGEFVAFVDSDDFCRPEMLENLYAQLRDNPNAAFSVCGTELQWDFDASEGSKCGKESYFAVSGGAFPLTPQELLSRPVVAWGKLFRAERIRERRILFPHGLQNEDEVFSVFYAAISPELQFSVSEKKLYVYRQRQDSIMGKIQYASRPEFRPDYFYGLNMVGTFLAQGGLFSAWETYFFEKIRRAFLQQKRSDESLAEKMAFSLLEKFGFARYSKRAEFPQLCQIAEKFAGTKLPNNYIPVSETAIPKLSQREETAPVSSAGTPLVSIIIPVYNVEKYLEDSLSSVLQQSLQDVEVICVDDGSTDGSAKILEAYAQKDIRLKVISQENRGQGCARNVGLAHAQGEFVYFMDADDVSPVFALATMFAYAKADRLDALLFSGDSFYESEALERSYPIYKTLYERKGDYPEVLSGQKLGTCLWKNRATAVQPCLMFFRRDFLRERGVKFPEGFIYEDNVFFFETLELATRAKCISAKLFRRRVREGSTMTLAKSFRNFNGYARVIRELERLAVRADISVEPDFFKVLRENAEWMSREIVRCYADFDEDVRAKCKALLVELGGEWLANVRRGTVKVDSKAEDCGPGGGVRVPAAKNAYKRYPAILVRLGAMFILNKGARKRWRERHMDLTPKDGIDLRANPELRRDSALKRFCVRAASLFIFSKRKRKAFRAKHLDLRPRDGVDIRNLSPDERSRRREAKRGKSVLRRVFDALVPVTRGKIVHTERHLRRCAEEQTRVLLGEIRAMRAEAKRRSDELKREIARARERGEAVEGRFDARATEIAKMLKDTQNRLVSYVNYRLLGDAFPNFYDKLRERNPLATREFSEELFASGANSPRIESYENWLTSQIRSAFSYKNSAYYETVLAASRERELKLWFKLRGGSDLNLENPKTFNEKIQWLKLYDASPLKTRLADKLAVRDWIKEKIGEAYLTRVLGVWDKFDEIDFDALPDKFVLKTNHGSGFNLVVADKSKFDRAAAKKRFDDWLSRKFEYCACFEMHYAGIKPRIFAEAFLDVDEKSAYDWSVFCVDGEPKIIRVVFGGAHSADHGTRIFYDVNWNKLPFTELRDRVPENEEPRPAELEEILSVSRKLSKGFIQVWVDFFRLRSGKFLFAEMTFTRASGRMELYPEEWNLRLGEMIRLPIENPPVREIGVDGNSGRNPRIVVSLTSHPARIKTVHLTVASLLQQTLKPDALVLWLADSQFPKKEAELPPELLALREFGLEIRWTKDVKSYKKLIPALKAFPRDIIVTADDDLIYVRPWLELLYRAHLEDPRCIPAHRITKIRFDGNDGISTVVGGYDYYPSDSCLNKLTGCGGVLYPPGCFHDDICDEEKFMALAPTNDDIWFWLMAALKGYYPKVVRGNIAKLFYVPGTQQCGLCRTNDSGGGQRPFLVQLKNVLRAYPALPALFETEQRKQDEISRWASVRRRDR